MAANDDERLLRPDGLDERYAAMLERRARALGTTKEDVVNRARYRPSFFHLAAKRAQRLGLSFGKLVEHDRQQLETSVYPAADCLQPYEIEEYLANKLPQSRQDHTRDCSGCAALLKAVLPSEHRELELLAAVQAEAAALAQGAELGGFGVSVTRVAVDAPIASTQSVTHTVTSVDGVSGPSHPLDTRRRFRFFGVVPWALPDAAAVCAVPLLFAIVGAIMWSTPSDLGQSLLAAGVTMHALLTLMAGVLVALALASVLSIAVPRPSQGWQAVGGSLLSGTIVTAAIAAAIWQVGEQRRRAAQDAIANLLAGSMSGATTTDVALPSSLLGVLGEWQHSRGAVYSMATISPRTERLVVRPFIDEPRGRLVIGTLKRLGSGEMVLVDQQAVEHRLKAGASTTERVEGVPYVGLLDPQTGVVTTLLQLSTAAAQTGGR